MEQARTEFYDGQRVAREDLEHLQDNLLQGLQDVRLAMAATGISWGFRVSAVADERVSVGAGLAIDPWGRPLVHRVATEIELNFTDKQALYLCAAYETSVLTEDNGRPLHIGHAVKFLLVADPPAAADAEIPVAMIRLREGGYEIIQHGAWYLPSLGAGHSGTFFEDRQGRWRYDGDPLRSSLSPQFDSAWLNLDANSDQTLEHGLRSQDLLVQLQWRPVAGTVSSQGNGHDFWYELQGDDTVRIFNDRSTPSDLRIMLWRIRDATGGPLLPVADAGLDREVEYGDNFQLNGSESRAFEGHSVVRYFWTMIG